MIKPFYWILFDLNIFTLCSREVRICTSDTFEKIKVPDTYLWVQAQLAAWQYGDKIILVHYFTNLGNIGPLEIILRSSLWGLCLWGFTFIADHLVREEVP